MPGASPEGKRSEGAAVLHIEAALKSAIGAKTIPAWGTAQGYDFKLSER
jgi:hypothetical protein